MRLVVQRVTSASVTVADSVVAEIGTGLLVLVGIKEGDTLTDAVTMAAKLVALRVFPGNVHPIDADIAYADGQLLLVPQFTLYGDCSKGNRPSFVKAMAPDAAGPFFDRFVAECRELWPKTQAGVFGADMQVQLVNNGPVTLVLDSDANR